MDYQGLLDKLPTNPMAAGLPGGSLTGFLGGEIGSRKSSKLVKMGAPAPDAVIVGKTTSNCRDFQA